MEVNLRLVDSETGNIAFIKQSIGRYIATIFSLISFGLGYFWIIFDQKNKTGVYRLSWTVVIKNKCIEKAVFEKLKKTLKKPK